ncbi:hypothetical protein [Salirhabdus salicampi]|uniref:hypothetical protein n=1 Tax=Salirhabdus salicampi TaxID=476102 RepID=UPI0020C1F580|nr:hypothetical protein [Salirhabdus salicampi]MCP8616661.1 hypothetical protein [Salirhabdus salicampi]
MGVAYQSENEKGVSKEEFDRMLQQLHNEAHRFELKLERTCHKQLIQITNQQQQNVLQLQKKLQTITKDFQTEKRKKLRKDTFYKRILTWFKLTYLQRG